MSNLEKFTSSLESDLAWRKKEVTNLLLLANENNQEIIIKSVILMTYSHWEGFVKNSCKAYLSFVAQKSLLLTNLTNNFKAIALKGAIKEVESSKDTLTLSNEIRLLELLSSDEEKKFTLKKQFKTMDRDKSIVNTKDNLSYRVFNSILDVMGIGRKKCLDSREVFLNEKLLENRNKIAHGNKISSQDDDFSLSIVEVKQIKNFIFTILDSLIDDLKFYSENECFLHSKINDSTNYLAESNHNLDIQLKKIFSI